MPIQLSANIANCVHCCRCYRSERCLRSWLLLLLLLSLRKRHNFIGSFDLLADKGFHFTICNTAMVCVCSVCACIVDESALHTVHKRYLIFVYKNTFARTHAGRTHTIINQEGARPIRPNWSATVVCTIDARSISSLRRFIFI